MWRSAVLACLLLCLSACGKSSPEMTLSPGESPDGSSVAAWSQEESVTQDPADEAEDLEPVSPPFTGTMEVDGWTAYTTIIPPEIGLSLWLDGRIDEDRLVFTSHDSEDYRKITAAVLDLSDLENLALTPMRQFHQPDTEYTITVHHGQVLCRYGPVVEVMDGELNTIRTITLPLEDGEEVLWCAFNRDFSLMAYAPAEPWRSLDFPNCLIMLLALDDSGERTEIPAYVERDGRGVAMVRPNFVAGDSKLMLPAMGFEFTGLYALMDLDGQNRRYYDRGGYWRDVKHRIVGDDFYISNYQISHYEENVPMTDAVLVKVDTLTGEETIVYQGSVADGRIFDFNETYLLLREDKSDARSYRYHIPTGTIDAVPEYPPDTEIRSFHIVEDGKVIFIGRHKNSDSVTLTILCKESP